MPFVVRGAARQATTPPAPTLTAVTSADAALDVRWFAQGDGGSALTRFVVTTRVASSGLVVRVDPTSTAGVTSLRVGPLLNGTAYTVSVQAVNMLGSSLASNTATATPVAAPVDPPPPDPEDPVDPPPPPPPVVVVPRPQPILYAFPVERAFRPEHWLLTPEEADAL